MYVCMHACILVNIYMHILSVPRVYIIYIYIQNTHTHTHTHTHTYSAAPERLALVVVCINKCRGRVERDGGGDGDGGRRGTGDAPSFTEEDERAALQCARFLLVCLNPNP